MCIGLNVGDTEEPKIMGTVKPCDQAEASPSKPKRTWKVTARSPPWDLRACRLGVKEKVNSCEALWSMPTTVGGTAVHRLGQSKVYHKKEEREAATWTM